MTHAIFDAPTHTIGEFIGAVLAIHETEAARDFFDEYVAWNQAHAMSDEYRTRLGAERLARSNIGFVFGEGMALADIAMWVEACGAAHPVFGTTLPSPTEALELGARLARRGA